VNTIAQPTHARKDRGAKTPFDEGAHAAGLVMLPQATINGHVIPYKQWIESGLGWTAEKLVACGYARRFYHPLERHARRVYRAWFWLWLWKNEHILEKFTEHALKAHAMGFEKYGASEIIGVIRWHSRERQIAEFAKVTDRSELEEEGFKITNDARSGLARLAMDMHPELAGLFNTHERGNGARFHDEGDEE
jgi:hypothetical protein